VRTAHEAHRVVDIGGLLGNRFERGSPQVGWTVAIGDAKDVQAPEWWRGDLDVWNG
jgi:hypothetical protein